MSDRELTGDPSTRGDWSRFAATAPAIASAVGFGVASIVWLVGGAWLPGDRWVVVHLFTLGVLTNLITAFTRHFTATFAGRARVTSLRRGLVTTVVLDASVVLLLVGRLTHGRVLLASGTVGIVAVVGANLIVLRRVQRGVATSRPGWIIRRYADAHVAFLVAAGFGTLVGTGAVGGAWFGAVRDAHLHLNVLGWTGLTVLTTMAVFTPVLLGVQPAPGVDRQMAPTLGTAAIALLVAADALVLAGVGGAPAMPARGIAVVGLIVYGGAVVVVMLTVRRVIRVSDRSGPRAPVAGAAIWFPVGVVTDIIVVATQQRSGFEIVGVMLFVGVFTQLILAVLLHLAPDLRGRDAVGRSRVLARTRRFAVGRSVIFNLGVVAVVAATVASAAADRSLAVLAAAGWTGVALGTGLHLAPLLLPPGREPETRCSSGP